MNLFTAHLKSAKKNSTQGGFTLVEMIVSLGIFTIVALVAVGALLKITDANKKSQSLKTAINNLNFALESMSREMRVGDVYHCDTFVVSPNIDTQNFTKAGCSRQTSGEWLVAFRSSQRGAGGCFLIHAYWYTPLPNGANTIKKAQQETCVQPNLVTADFHELLSPEINITASIFEVAIDGANNYPPKAFFWLKGYAGVRDRDKTEFEVQTTISQRN